MIALTPLGVFLRNLRNEHFELMKDMAEKLGVSPAFLSSVETGRKTPPVGWMTSLPFIYGLDEKKSRELQLAIDQSQRNASINLEESSPQHREVAVALARQFNDLSAEHLELIKRTMEAARTKNKKD